MIECNAIQILLDFSFKIAKSMDEVLMVRLEEAIKILAYIVIHYKSFII